MTTKKQIGILEKLKGGGAYKEKISKGGVKCLKRGC